MSCVVVVIRAAVPRLTLEQVINNPSYQESSPPGLSINNTPLATILVLCMYVRCRPIFLQDFRFNCRTGGHPKLYVRTVRQDIARDVCVMTWARRCSVEDVALMMYCTILRCLALCMHHSSITITSHKHHINITSTSQQHHNIACTDLRAITLICINRLTTI